jgi:hypothetical protein
MAKMILVITYSTLTIFCLVIAISIYRYKKGLTIADQEKLSQGIYPWWYYVGGIIPFALILGPFGDEIKLIGSILFIGLLGLGWRWKLRRK